MQMQHTMSFVSGVITLLSLGLILLILSNHIKSKDCCPSFRHIVNNKMKPCFLLSFYLPLGMALGVSK